MDRVRRKSCQSPILDGYYLHAARRAAGSTLEAEGRANVRGIRIDLENGGWVIARRERRAAGPTVCRRIPA